MIDYKDQPEYCMIPDDGQPGSEGPCPGCGATQEGNDPVQGICQARKAGPRPTSLLDFVLLDKKLAK